MLSDLNPRTDTPLDFPDREFGQLAPADYAELGFMCGLEVHQQLSTATKLFCRCPSGRRTRAVDAEVLRHMRPTLSELGEYDGCALMEQKTRKEIVYQLARSCVCTYEMDDTPPFEIDENAVRIAIDAARLFDLSLVSELHVMRKQYLDGSIPTGFQRTAMIGLGGVVPFPTSELGSDRELRIRQLSLEEDSCREVSDIGHRITFRTDRLGEPLIETVTEPELLTPLDSRAGVELLASIARQTGAVRRGPGAARQDVNVSIAGGRRIEIKGVPSARRVPLLVHNEAMRQLNLLRIRAALAQRGITAETFTIESKGLPWELTPLVVEARVIVRRCDFAPLQDALERGDSICAVRLPGFGGLLRHPLQPGIRFDHEFTERVRVIACLTSRPFALCAETDSALGNSTWRAIDALTGVPSETRQARADGTTGFERILPGPERMYPDTDTPPLPIPDEWIRDLAELRSERPWQRPARLASLGIDPRTAAHLAQSRWVTLFDQLEPTAGATAKRVATALAKRMPRWLREHGADALPDASRLRPVVAAIEAGKLRLDAFDWVLDRLLIDTELTPEAAIALHRPADNHSALDARIAELAPKRPRSTDHASTLRWAMGSIMRQFPRGMFDPREVRTRIASVLQLEENAG